MFPTELSLASHQKKSPTSQKERRYQTAIIRGPSLFCQFEAKAFFFCFRDGQTTQTRVEYLKTRVPQKERAYLSCGLTASRRQRINTNLSCRRRLQKGGDVESRPERKMTLVYLGSIVCVCVRSAVSWCAALFHLSHTKREKKRPKNNKRWLSAVGKITAVDGQPTRTTLLFFRYHWVCRGKNDDDDYFVTRKVSVTLESSSGKGSRFIRYGPD